MDQQLKNKLEREDMASQFEKMVYTIFCNTCGEEIATILLRDLNGSIPSMGRIHSVSMAVRSHNSTHYVPPKKS